MKYSKQQIFTIAAAVLFLIGAVFMLVTSFASQVWAFWVGLGFAVAAMVFYVLLIIENRKDFSRKMGETVTEPAAVNAAAETAPVKTEVKTESGDVENAFQPAKSKSKSKGKK